MIDERRRGDDQPSGKVTGGRVVVVGASAAGLTCACRIARLEPGRSVTVVEARDVFSFSACGLPYVLSGEIEDMDALRRTNTGQLRDAEYFAAEKGVEVLAGWKATAVDPERRTLTISAARGRETQTLPYDELVLATGAKSRRVEEQPRHPRVHDFHTWDDLQPLLKGLRKRGGLESVAIVGAGLVGCELADAFRSLWQVDVTMIEEFGAPLPRTLDPELGLIVQGYLEREMGIEVITETEVTRVVPDAEGVTLRAGSRSLRSDAVVVATGVEPVVELAKSAGVALGQSGAISVSEQMATTVPHVYAVGDCVEVRLAASGGVAHMPAGSFATRQGRVLANVLCGRQDRFLPVAGAIVLKTGELNVGVVGSSGDRSNLQRMAHRAVWLTTEDKAPYWPEAELLHMKMTYDPRTRRVLGVQAVGRGNVARRIDMATQLICRHATVEDFVQIEHAYTPPFSPATEPLAVLARLAQNQEDGLHAVGPLGPFEGSTFIDVRDEGTRERFPLGMEPLVGAGIGELREDSSSLEEGRYVIACGHGTRSAQALSLPQEPGRGRDLPRRRVLMAARLGTGQGARLLIAILLMTSCRPGACPLATCAERTPTAGATRQ